ncbi:MAG: cytochrome C peroxidase [Fimbriiglobus sp.]|jgi:cytochrome c peroxidase|nr:cytochrome C peroxidase [Fimbriiglobus sp.]
MSIPRSLFVLALAPLAVAAPPVDDGLPNEAKKLPFKDDARIEFVAGTSPEWKTLPKFWNEATEGATDPATGQKVTKRVVKLKVPLGLSTAPAVPTENPMTVAKWELGKKLYFSKILSSNGTRSCASCHDPKLGWSDQSKTSSGINDQLGPINSPTVVNSAFNRFQFWNGRADSLENQSQGPVGNALEMFGGGKGDPWEEAVGRILKDAELVKRFEQVFGHGPSRDAAAKAIATFERTVLCGNSIVDRAEVEKRKRLSDDDTGKNELTGPDVAKAIQAAFAAKDTNALKALKLDPEKDAGKAAVVGEQIALGRAVFFGKARCSNCHIGDGYTDHGFHNLGVGVKDGKLPRSEFGRYDAQPTGHKDPALVGANKTPGLRGLLDTAPYLHDGSETTLESVIDFYDRGGNVNEFLSPKMRDTAAEAEYRKAKAEGKTPELPKGAILDRAGNPVIPFLLKLTADEKAALVLFLRALQGDPVDATVADEKWLPGAAK